MTDETAKPKRQRLTDEQREARLQQQLARLRERRKRMSKKQRDHQLIILGGTVIAEMRDNPVFREQFARVLKARVTRPDHLEVIAEWLSATSMQE